MTWCRAGLLAVAVVASVALGGCADENEPADSSSGTVVGAATATMVSMSGDSEVAEVSVTLRSADQDEVSGASVERAFAGEVTLSAFTSSKGGDGHLGHLDPQVGSTHTHGDRLAIDLPEGQDVKIGPGGVARILVRDLVGQPSAGDTFELTLEFDKAKDQQVKVTFVS